MRVRYSYLEEQFANAEEIILDVRRLLKRADYTLGEAVGEFEEKFAHLCNVRYAVGVNSGTDALILSMKALEIDGGDEVITVPNSFIATVGAIIAAGATPVFVDIGDDYNIDPTLIESAITERTKAIMPVHYTGNPAMMQEIMKIAEKYNLYVIEDACQAIGAAINGRPVGSFGVTAAFSLHPLKNLNVWGDGGVITTNSEEVYRRLCLLRNHGLKNRDEVEIFGYNSRLDTLQAIVGLHLMKKLEQINETRIRNARVYDESLKELDEFITIPPRRESVRHVYHIYMVQVEERDKLYRFLLSHGVEAKIHYPIPIHLQRAAKHLGYKEGDFPKAEAQAKSIISLPVHQHLTNQQMEYVIEKVKAFYKDRRIKG
jgi:dTDP-4-amino-4,6-dideoxygalactose transaminase